MLKGKTLDLDIIKLVYIPRPYAIQSLSICSNIPFVFSYTILYLTAEIPQLQIQTQPLTTKALLVETQQKLQATESKLIETQQKLQMFQDLLMAIESSKFWKLRQLWFDIKRKLNIKVDDTCYQNYISSIGRQSVIKQPASQETTCD